MTTNERLEAALLVLDLPKRMDAATTDLERAALAREAARCARVLGWEARASALDEDADRYDRWHARDEEARLCNAGGGTT